MAKAARVLIAALLCLGIIVWCRLQLLQQQAVERWDDVKTDGAAASLSFDQLPPLKSAFQDRASIRLNSTFPPDRDGVRADLQQAISRAPLSSDLWFTYAQNELFAGNVSAGRSALLRSDELDPFFPGQLLRSIQLWSLLGEQERAIAIARNVASLGFQYRLRSADELSQMGVSPREIFEMISTNDLSPVQTGNLLNAIRTNSKEQLIQIFDGIPQKTFDDAGFRLLALQRATNPLLPGVIERIWRAESPGAQWLDGCLVENIDLQKSPFKTEFPLGWQQIPAQGNGGGAWVAPDAGNDQRASIRIAFSRVDWGKDGPVSITFPFYQLPWDGHAGLNVYTSIRSSGGTGNAWLTTITRKHRLQSESIKTSETPQRLSLYIPRSADPEILTISLNARAIGQAPDSQTTLFMDGFSIEAEGPAK
ncbi:MAG: hypothetical protein ABI579_01535 [Candidatus Sumerlaeota bacterium]